MGHPQLDMAGRNYAYLDRLRRQRNRLLIIGHALTFAAGLALGVML